MNNFENSSSKSSNYDPKDESVERESASPITYKKRGEKTEQANFLSSLYEKARSHPAVGLAITFAAVAVIGLTASLGQGGDKAQNSANTTTIAGEQENGVSYDYSHYLDYENKISHNAYDYSLADAYGDRGKTQDAIMDVATRNPEALASYAYAILDENEKQELGLGDMNMAQIDDAISNGENGGALQKKILAKLSSVLSSDDTKLEFYKENDFETTSYVYFVDDNKDGTATPSEMHLAYSKSKRQGAPQVDILRKTKTIDGGVVWAKKADLNMNCGGQINSNESFPGLQEINEETPPTEDTPSAEPVVPLQKKNAEEQKKNAGPRATQEVQSAPQTTIEQDLEVVNEAKKQISDGGMAGTQEEKEKQKEADEQAAVLDEEAKENASKDANERAAMFVNGDY